MSITMLPLKRFVDSARPITYGIVQAGPDVEGGVPYIRPVDMEEHRGVRDPDALRTTSQEIAATYRRSRIQCGDLVVSIGPSFGKTMLVDDSRLEGANLTQGTARVAPAPGVHGRFLQWALQSRRAIAHWEASVGGATFRALNLGPLAETPVPRWEPRRQRAIADYLDTETARIDALIDKKQRLVGVLGERVAAEVEECLVKAGTQVPLRRLLAEPPQYGAGESGETAVEGHPRYIRITDLTADGLLRRENAKSLPPEVARPYMLSDGDLLVARSGATAGKAFLYAREMGAACYAGYLIRLRFNQDMVDSRLLELWMQTAHYRGQISESAVQATIQNVNAERYKSLLVPLPAREDQGSLASSLLQARGRSRRLAHEVARQVALLQEHRKALITAAVTGEIEVPGVAV